MQHQRSAKLAAEFIGTFFLVFAIGCNVHTGSVGAAISIGAMLMVMVYSLGSVSGGHFNPAVTFAVLISGRGKIELTDAGLYMLSQVAGGICGALAYWAIVDKAFIVAPVGLYSTADAWACEILYTWALCYVVLNVATTEGELGNVPNYYFGLAIGFTVTAAAIAVGPISGCSLNPAVSIGSMTVARLAHGAKATTFCWPYILAPFAGAVIAALFFFVARERYEYPVSGSPPPKKEAVVEEVKPEPPPVVQTRSAALKPAGTKHLRKQETVELNSLGDLVESHNLFVGLSWQVTVSQGLAIGVDIDAACVKFDRDGEPKGAVYFAEKKDYENGIEYSGDALTGSLESGEGDNETIKFKLSQVKPDVHFLFFCMTIFSSGVHSFKDVKNCGVRLVDIDEGNREVLKYSKKEVSQQGNALVVAMIYRNGPRWCFQAVDACYQIQEHGTYRALVPELKRFCQQTTEIRQAEV